MTLIRHRQGIVHAITPNAGNRRWLKGARSQLAPPVYSPLALVDNPPDVTLTEGQAIPGSWSLLRFFTGGTPPVWYSATGLPAGMVLDPLTAAVSGSVAAGSAGPYAATITAHDQLTTVDATWNILVELSSAGVSGFTNEFDQRAYL